MNTKSKQGDDRTDLESLREQIVELDRQLLSIVARRNAVVESIAKAKSVEGASQALFDRKRERFVYERAYETGGDLGLPRAITHHLMQVLVEASHLIQENVSRQSVRAASHADGPVQFLIVGGGGQMGRRLQTELTQRSHAVDVVEADHDESTVRQLASKADIAIIAVPMTQQCPMIERIAPYMSEDALLCDINSLKKDVCESMRQYGRSETIGMHPMFGPTVHTLRRQKIVICPVNPGPRAEWLSQELGRMGLEIVKCEPEQHDRMMAVIQVLVHYSTIVMGRALSATGIKIEDSLRLTSPIYRLELAFVSRLFVQNADLYAQIEMSNPYGDNIRQLFRDAATEWDQIIQARDTESFRKLFESVGSYFHGFSEEAMQLSDRIIDTMVRDP